MPHSAATIATADVRKAYCAPELEVFGEVAALTAGGTGTAAEGSNSTLMMRRP